MESLSVKTQVKINQQELQNFYQESPNKEEISANTEPPEEIKIKLETKLPNQQKYQPFQNFNAANDSADANNLHGHNLENLMETPNLKRRRRALSHHDRLEDVRLVAANFIEYGLNFRKFNQFYPDIDAKFYRNTVEAINNTAINQIQKYLRYECNIQIQKLNRDQKRSIRTQLTKVRQWLGKKDMGQLQTLYKFIQRKYELIDVQISIQEALKFYKTILQIVKSPFVDVMQDDIKSESLDPEAHKLANKQQRQMQEKTLIFLYIQHRNLTKVSDLLCQKFGYTIKWSKHAVKQKIKYLLRSSLKKLIGSVEAYDKNIKLFFSESEQCVDLLIRNENSLNLKVFLLGFYLQKTITLIELREYIKNVNKFFIQEYKAHGQYECKQFEQNVKIPKLQIKGAEQQKILLEENKSNNQVKIGENSNKQLIKEEKNIDWDQKNQIFDKEQQENEKKNKKSNEAVLEFQQCFFSSEFDRDQNIQQAIKLQH